MEPRRGTPFFIAPEDEFWGPRKNARIPFQNEICYNILWQIEEEGDMEISNAQNEIDFSDAQMQSFSSMGEGESGGKDHIPVQTHN